MSRHVLVIANETAASQSLIEKLEAVARDDALVTVIAPVNQPSQGYVVYQDTRRASAGRRLDRTLKILREAQIRANGMVVETEPVAATRDAIAQLEPPVTEVIVSTHPRERSGWLRRDVVERVRKCAAPLPVEHVVAVAAAGDDETNVLVVANQTLVSDPLVERIRERARKGQASFLIIAPLSGDDADDSERRLRRLLSQLRADGIDAHGQVAHPDPHTAAMQAVHDERVDEIIVSTLPGERSGWLRRDLVERLRNDTAVPVDHVVSELARAEAPA